MISFDRVIRRLLSAGRVSHSRSAAGPAAFGQDDDVIDDAIEPPQP